VALIGAVLISAAVRGFETEWLALFKKPFGPARFLIYLLSAFFQFYNGVIHRIAAWEIVVLALLTALSAIGIHDFAKKRSGA